MNKKIQELAYKSGFDFYQNGTQTTITSDKNLEKFAELIIEECTGVIEKNLFKGIGWNTSKAVKRHFGMEDEE